MAEVKGDSKAAIDFLRHWAPDSPWVLNAIDPERKKGLIAQSFNQDTADKALAFIEHWNGKRNLYFMVNVPRKPMFTKAEKADVGFMQALHVDVDPVNPPKDASPTELELHYADEHARIVQALNAYEPKPSVVLFSGGGYQGFWLLREAVEIDEPTETLKEPWAALEAYNRTPEKALGGDHCFNIDRIMRLPGTVNLPDAKKKLKGRTPALARLVSADWDAVYELANFEPYVEPPKGKGKRSAGKKRGATKKDDWVERVLTNGPDHEGPRAFGGDRSRALWAVCCTLVRRQWSDEDIIEAILNKDNKLSEHVHAQTNPRKYAERQTAKAREAVGEDYARDDKDKIILCQANIRMAFNMLEVQLSHNAFARKDMIEGPRGAPLRVLQKADMVQVRLLMDEECYFRVPKDYFNDVIENECKVNKFHPVRDYLDKLQHDGEPRIDTWLTTYAGAPDTPYTRAVGAIVLMAAVRRVRHPGVKFDEMVIFESAQGLDKSSALQALAVNPDWFSDSLPLDADDKQVIEVMDGKWIVEAPELKGIRGKSMEHLKAFLSRQVDRARLSYDPIVSEVPRQSVIFASTNSKTYLSDITGNRRFWPVPITMFNILKLVSDRDQLWAEASAREAAGESIRLNPSLYGDAAKEQEERFIEDPWLSLFETALATTPTGKILNVDVWNVVNIPIGLRNQNHNVRIGDTMRALGWERKPSRINGITKKCYVKGSEEERKIRILIDRTDLGGLVVQYEGLPLHEGREDMSIPP